MYEKRQFERRPYEKTVDYSVNILEFRKLVSLDLQANVSDISEGGICLRTNYPLENGHILKFHTDIGRFAGIVRWCSPVSHSTFKAGVKFI